MTKKTEKEFEEEIANDEGVLKENEFNLSKAFEEVWKQAIREKWTFNWHTFELLKKLLEGKEYENEQNKNIIERNLLVKLEQGKYKPMNLKEINKWEQESKKTKLEENKRIIRLIAENKALRNENDFIRKIYKRDDEIEYCELEFIGKGHENYFKPLEVMFVCRNCHGELDRLRRLRESGK